MSRRLLHLTGFVLVATAALACGTSSPPSSTGGAAPTSEQPRSGGTLKVLQKEDPPDLSIYEQSTFATSFPMMPAYSNLVLFDPGVAPESLQSIRPELADKWETSADGKKITFQLKKGLKWHDGTAFTAKDVKYTFDTLKTGTDAVRPDVKMRANPRGVWFDNVESVTTPDDYTAVFTLKRAQPALMGMFASGYSPIYPSHVPVADLRAKPAGTGPFKFQEWRKGELVSFTKNSDYFVQGRPYLDGLQYIVITERGTQIGAMRTKQILLSFPNEFTKLNAEELKKAVPEIVIEEQVSTVNDNVIMNTKKEPWSNQKVRTAVAESIDLAGYVSARSGGAAVGTNVTPTGPWALPKDEMAKLPGYGPNIEQRRTRAKQLLTEAGYASGFTTELVTRDVKTYTDLAVFVIDQLDKIGIKATLKPIQTGVWHAQMSQGNFDIGLNLTGLGVDDPDVMFYENLRCGQARNYSQWCDQEVDKLTDEQSATLELAKRKQLIQQLDRLVIERSSRPVMGWSIRYEAWWPEVRGYKALASPYNAGRMENVWLAR